MPSAEFEQLVAQFERFQSKMQRVEQDFSKVGEMQQQLAEMEAVATSADRAVTVVAGPSGAIKDIRLTDLAMRRPPAALASELMSTLQKAIAEAARLQASIVEGTMGNNGMNLSDQVMETQAQLFGMSKEDLKAAAAHEAPAPPPPPAAHQQPVRPPMPPMPQPGLVRQPPPPPARKPAPEPLEDFSDQNVLRSNSADRSPQPLPPAKQDGRFLNLYDDEDGGR